MLSSVMSCRIGVNWNAPGFRGGKLVICEGIENK